MNEIRSFSVPLGLVRIALIFFLIEFVRGAILISYIPKYAVSELYLTVTTVGFAVTMHYAADTFAKLGMGYLLDRLPLPWILHSSFALSAVGLLMLQYALEAWVLVIGAILFGIGASPIWIVGLSSVTEQERGKQMGALFMAWMLGLGLGPVVLNFFIDWFPYGFSFILLLSMLGISWVISSFLGSREPASHPPAFGEQLEALVKHMRAVKPLLPGMILQTLGAAMLLPVLPTFAEENLKLTTSEYSFLLITGGAFAVLSLLPMGRLSDKLGKKWFLVGGFLSFGFSLYMITTIESLWTCLFWAMVLGVSYGAVLPAWNALLAQFVPPRQKGVGWGVFSTVEGLGIMCGPVIGGIIADAFGLTAPFYVCTALFLFIGLFYLWFPMRLFR